MSKVIGQPALLTSALHNRPCTIKTYSRNQLHHQKPAPHPPQRTRCPSENTNHSTNGPTNRHHAAVHTHDHPLLLHSRPQATTSTQRTPPARPDPTQRHVPTRIPQPPNPPILDGELVEETQAIINPRWLNRLSTSQNEARPHRETNRDELWLKQPRDDQPATTHHADHSTSIIRRCTNEHTTGSSYIRTEEIQEGLRHVIRRTRLRRQHVAEIPDQDRNRGI